VAVFRCIVQTD